MTLLLLAPIVVPLAAAAITAAAGWRGWTSVGAVMGALTILGCGVVLAFRLGTTPHVLAGGLLRVDALSVVMLIVIGAVGVLSTVAAVGYINTELDHGHTGAAGARLYGTLTPAFLASWRWQCLPTTLASPGSRSKRPP